MKKVIVAALLVLVLVSLAMPAKPVLAIPLVSISPTQGEPGSRVYITGSGFTPGLNFFTYFARGTSFEISRNPGTVSASGTIYDTFPVPEIPAGVYTVSAETTITESGFSSFTVIPAMTLNKTSALVGTAVLVNGVGFKAASPMAINFESIAVAAVTTGANGSFTGASFTVPEAIRGNHLISVTDADSHTANAVLAVINTMSVTPSSGATGATVTIKGTGFRGNAPMIVTFDGAALSTSPATVITSSAGSFSATFAVPPSPKRTHEIVVSDETNVSNATFASVGSISIAPDSGNVGTQVIVRGSGFEASKTITIKLDATQVGTATIDQFGGFSTGFGVPPSATGSHTVTASDGTESAISRFTTSGSASINPTTGAVNTEVAVKGTGLAASRPVNITFDNAQVKSTTTDANGSLDDKFTVPRVRSGSHTVVVTDGLNTLNFSFTTTASLKLNQATGNIGSSLTVSGSGFSGTVTVKYDNNVVATTTAEASGEFFVTFSVPVSVRGNHVMSASDSVNSMQASFSVESTPPQSPVLTLPARDSDAKGDIRFDWSDVTDPSQPVVYNLQVANSRDFTPATMVLERKGLLVSEYVLTKGEQLKPASKDAPYYWRVRAIDSASNESDWSGVSSFYISSFPDLAKYALIGAGVLIVALLIFWLGRRTKRAL